MFPVTSATNGAVRPVQPVEQASPLRSSQYPAAETGRTSLGEVSAANIRTESAQAVKAAEQAAVASRLRDQERAEQIARSVPSADTPAGPPPAFEESPLERQARLAFAPPDLPVPASEARQPGPAQAEDAPTPEPEAPAADDAPPPTPTQRAEASFAETRVISAEREPATLDVDL